MEQKREVMGVVIKIFTLKECKTMNKQKLHDYWHTGGIHTLSIVVPGTVQATTQAAQDCIAVTIRTTKDGEIESLVTINPNKYHGDIFRFSEFKETMEAILNECGITEYRFIRTDLRMDNYAPRQYELYSKLNRYLLMAVMIAYGIKNKYFSGDLLTLKQLTQVIKGRDFEIENYDRAAKSRQTENHAELAQYRLEIRTMPSGWRKIYAADNDKSSNMELLKADLLGEWFQRFDAALSNLDKVQEAYNEILEKEWSVAKDAMPVQFGSITEFVRRYQGVIFTRKQLIDLYQHIDDSGADPVQKANNYKKRYGIEFFSKADMQAAVQEIKRCIEHFCER